MKLAPIECVDIKLRRYAAHGYQVATIWAIVQVNELWRVTHTPTGCGVGPCLTLERARGLAEACATTWNEPGDAQWGAACGKMGMPGRKRWEIDELAKAVTG